MNKLYSALGILVYIFVTFVVTVYSIFVDFKPLMWVSAGFVLCQLNQIWSNHE